jgi:hypothetical protein
VGLGLSGFEFPLRHQRNQGVRAMALTPFSGSASKGYLARDSLPLVPSSRNQLTK